MYCPNSLLSISEWGNVYFWFDFIYFHLNTSSQLIHSDLLFVEIRAKPGKNLQSRPHDFLYNLQGIYIYVSK